MILVLKKQVQILTQFELPYISTLQRKSRWSLKISVLPRVGTLNLTARPLRWNLCSVIMTAQIVNYGRGVEKLEDKKTQPWTSFEGKFLWAAWGLNFPKMQGLKISDHAHCFSFNYFLLVQISDPPHSLLFGSHFRFQWI